MRQCACTMLLVIGFTRACIHDEMEFTKPGRGDQRYFEDRRMPESAYPIRITFDTRLVEKPTVTIANQSYVKALVAYAQERLRMALSVQPVVGNLLVPRNCSNVERTGINAGKCTAASSINRCGEVQIPEEHLGPLSVWSSSGIETNISAGSGIPNTDLLVYVTLSTTSSCSVNSLAYASACRIDQKDRPVVGAINFCPDQTLATNDPFQIAKDRTVALHEIIHVLGFSSVLFSFFRDENGNPRTPRCPSAPGCTANDDRGYPPFNSMTMSYVISSSTVFQSTRRDVPIKYLVTPSVRRVARAYFGCLSVPGAELENGGQAMMTAGSHWEKRILLSEMMTGSISARFPEILSEFTLALLADSGWYKVNYSAADPTPLKFGRGLGCAFLDTDCATAAGYPYCRATKDVRRTGCTFDQSALGQCVEDGLMDGCGIFFPFADGRCDNADGRTSPVMISCGKRDCRGSFLGPGAACLNSTVLLSGYTVSGLEQGCYAYRCPGSPSSTSTSLEVLDPLGAWRPCASPGEALQVAGPDYAGAITCPPSADTLCARSCASGPCSPGQYPLACTAQSPGGCAACDDPSTAACVAFLDPALIKVTSGAERRAAAAGSAGSRALGAAGLAGLVLAGLALG